MPRGLMEKTKVLHEHIRNVLLRDRPQTVRQIFYQCLDDGVHELARVPKTMAGYNRVQRACLYLRRERIIPFGWIQDLTRTAYVTSSYLHSDSEGFLESVRGQYRQDMWEDADKCVEVWCESRGTAGSLRILCRGLGVDLYPTGGQPSETFVYSACESANGYGKELAIIYIGDLDDAGVQIENTLYRKLTDYIHVPFTIERVAVTREQRDEYNLPSKLAKTQTAKIKRTVEAESLPAGVLRSWVEDAVNEHMDPSVLKVAKTAEEHERRFLNYIGLQMGGMRREYEFKSEYEPDELTRMGI